MAISDYARPLDNIVRRQIRRTIGKGTCVVKQVKFNRIASCFTLVRWSCYRCRPIERTAESKLSSVGGGPA